MLLTILSTHVDIEDLTYKAGNVKKMGAFAKMLALAFSKNNDKVHVEVLTFTDIALKKAQKMGASVPTSASMESGQNSTRFQKRYVIMTYRGEFDSKDVHYPLPLDFEDKPNFPALKRVIGRLRKQVAELETQEHEPSSEKERYDTMSDTVACP